MLTDPQVEVTPYVGLTYETSPIHTAQEMLYRPPRLRLNMSTQLAVVSTQS